MKAFLKSIPIAVIFLSLIACNEAKTKEIRESLGEEIMSKRQPNASDKAFTAAFDFLERNKKKEAAKAIEQGISELQKEGANLKGLYRLNLEKAIAGLQKAAINLNKEKPVSLNSLKELVLQAEINIPHQHLVPEGN
jgi:hypothetical protein